MKKANPKSKETLRREYERSDFPNGVVRGKYAKRAEATSNIVVLEPEIADAFPDSAAVNNALRMIVKVAKRVADHP